jgi:hypothetical protein
MPGLYVSQIMGIGSFHDSIGIARGASRVPNQRFKLSRVIHKDPVPDWCLYQGQFCAVDRVSLPGSFRSHRFVPYGRGSCAVSFTSKSGSSFATLARWRRMSAETFSTRVLGTVWHADTFGKHPYSGDGSHHHSMYA